VLSKPWTESDLADYQPLTYLRPWLNLAEKHHLRPLATNCLDVGWRSL